MQGPFKENTREGKWIYYYSNEKIESEGDFLNDKQINIDQLAESVNTMLAEQEDKNVVIRADSQVDYGKIIHVMDLLRKKGIYKIIISTQKPESDN